MIATGGLLRYNARRQDSLRSKPRVKPKKTRKKRRQEVVVVRGKIQLCSVSGLVAVLGLLVLLVGGVLAAVGYCPQDVLLFRDRAEGVAANRTGPTPVPLEDGLNSSQVNSTLDFLQRFLDSDRLKVLGPLVMGVGIFLFLCANAVLLENRDKKTKVIKLRDIYSTVIDLHQTRDQTQDQTRDQSLDQYRDQSRDQNRQNHSLEAGTTPERWGRENGNLSLGREAEAEGLLSKWQLRKGGSMKERREVGEGRREGGVVFSIFHEHRFSLPPGFSFHRAASEKRRRKPNENELKSSNQSAGREEEAESMEQEEAESREEETTVDTSFFSLIGSQRPLLTMSCSSLSPARHTPPANQRRGSMFIHTHRTPNRRSSWV